MTRYAYKVIPAPTKGPKAPGVKGIEARFAHGLEDAMNDLAADGWEYLRADILPSEERQGLTSTRTVYRSVLVFRREIDENAPAASDTRTGPPLTARRPREERMVADAARAPRPVITATAGAAAQDQHTTDAQASNDPPEEKIAEDAAETDRTDDADTRRREGDDL